MDGNQIIYWLTWVDTVCWVMCFWWMFRISSRQNAVLKELKEQAQRIEKLSKAEHQLIKEVHPQVGEIKQAVEQVAEAVKETPEEHPSS